MQRYHHRDDDEHSGAERYVGGDSEEAVVDQHEDDDESRADEAGLDAVAHGVGSERRSYGPVLKYFDGYGQSAGAQHDGEPVGLFGREGARYLRFAAGYALLNDGGRDDRSVEHYRYLLVDVGGSGLVEELRAFRIEGERYRRLAELVEGRLGLRQVSAAYVLLAEQVCAASFAVGDSHLGIVLDGCLHLLYVKADFVFSSLPALLRGFELLVVVVVRADGFERYSRRLAEHLAELENGGAPYKVERSLRVVNAGKADRHAVVAFALYYRFNYSVLVYSRTQDD